MFDNLIQEIMSGELKRDVLPNDNGYEFSGELQAMYFSRLRRNMASIMAHKVMHEFQDNRALAIADLMKG